MSVKLIWKKGCHSLNERSSRLAKSYGDVLMIARCAKRKQPLTSHPRDTLLMDNLDRFARDINTKKIYVQDLLNHRKRRSLTKWHLWIVYIKVSNQINKRLIASQIVVDLLKDMKPTSIHHFLQLFKRVFTDHFETELLFRTYFLYPYL